MHVHYTTYTTTPVRTPVNTCAQSHSVHSSSKDLLEHLLARNPAARLSATDALQHDWVTAGYGLRSTTELLKQKKEAEADAATISPTISFHSKEPS